MEHEEEDCSNSSGSSDYYGPALPPHMINNSLPNSSNAESGQSILGPCLPPGIREALESAADAKGKETNADSGHKISLSAHLEKQDGAEEDDSDDDVVGPFTADDPRSKLLTTHYAQSSSDSQKLKREEWMLIAPKNKTISDLSMSAKLKPRSFMAKTPSDAVLSDEDDEGKSEKEAIQDSIIHDYNERMEAMKTASEKDKKVESLMEIHQRKLKKAKKEKKKKKKGKKEQDERKPFDRNTDMHVSMLSSTDKKKFLERASELSSKFKCGKQKFL